MNKIGVNESCPCGSGIKFKRCCRLKGIIYQEDFDLIKQSLLIKKEKCKDFNVYNELLVDKPIIQTKLRNIRGVLVGPGFYVRDSRETFQDFLVHQLKDGLSWKWGANETQKILDQRHVYLMVKFVCFSSKERNNTRKSLKGKPLFC